MPDFIPRPVTVNFNASHVKSVAEYGLSSPSLLGQAGFVSDVFWLETSLVFFSLSDAGSRVSP